jgi:protein-tyrosine phosphatase
MKPSPISSFITKIIIEIQRAVDHSWRWTTGMPQVKRSLITPQLYLGGQYALRSIEDMRKLGITAIVSMRITTPFQDRLQGFKVLHLPTIDRTPVKLEDLKTGVTFIDEEVKAGKKVYIHCKYGEGRGASMVIAYLISQGMTYQDAFDLVKKVRTFIRPSLAQIERLKEFEELEKNK